MYIIYNNVKSIRYCQIVQHEYTTLKKKKKKLYQCLKLGHVICLIITKRAGASNIEWQQRYSEILLKVVPIPIYTHTARIIYNSLEKTLRIYKITDNEIRNLFGTALCKYSYIYIYYQTTTALNIMINTMELN